MAVTDRPDLGRRRRFDLDGTGRVAAADDVERDEGERADRGGERDPQSPSAGAGEGGAQARRPAASAASIRSQLGVERGPVLGRVELDGARRRGCSSRTVFTLPSERDAQGGARAVQSRGDRALGDAEHLCRVAVVEALRVDEEHGRALLLGQRRERAREVAPARGDIGGIGPAARLVDVLVQGSVAVRRAFRSSSRQVL